MKHATTVTEIIIMAMFMVIFGLFFALNLYIFEKRLDKEIISDPRLSRTQVESFYRRV